MFKVTAAIALCLASLTTYAEQRPQQTEGMVMMEKPVKCGRADLVFQVLEENFQEKQIWIGVDAPTKSYVALLMNPDKTTWTMLQYKDGLACILAAGSQSTPL